MTTNRISLHGGHSKRYCNHATDDLEDIIRAYIQAGFSQVGISEHIPPVSDAFLYPDEIEAGLTARSMMVRFADYFSELSVLKQKYADQIRIFIGMETETVAGYVAHVQMLCQHFNPDYLVGSVHHVKDIGFDYSRSEYQKAVDACGGTLEDLYLAYFDLQYDMIKKIKPFVVGHFDIIRMYDEAYETRLKTPAVRDKIKRNLRLVKSIGAVLDFNLRPLARGHHEPYVAPSILGLAKEMDICLVPGDDSHGVKEAGNHVDTAIRILTEYGFSTAWPEPRRLA